MLDTTTITRSGGGRRSSPPAAPVASVFSTWRKVCGCCGRAHRFEQWLRLPEVGRQPDVDPDTFEVFGVLELRNCPCGSTLAVDLLAIAELAKEAHR